MAVLTKRTAFLHLPKTGGTTVRAFLDTHGLIVRETNSGEPLASRMHSTFRQAQSEIGPDRFVMIASRDPLDWYVSFWRHRQRHGTPKGAGWMPVDDVWSDDFTTWVRNVIGMYPDGLYTRMFQGFTDGLIDAPNQWAILSSRRLLTDLCWYLEYAGEENAPSHEQATAFRPLNAAPRSQFEVPVMTDEAETLIVAAEHKHCRPVKELTA